MIPILWEDTERMRIVAVVADKDEAMELENIVKIFLLEQYIQNLSKLGNNNFKKSP